MAILEVSEVSDVVSVEKRVALGDLDFVKAYCQGCADDMSLADIAANIGMKPASVTNRVNALVKGGRYVGLERFCPAGSTGKRGRKGMSHDEMEEFAVAYLDGCDNGKTIAEMATAADMSYGGFIAKLKRVKESTNSEGELSFPEVLEVEPAKGKRGRKSYNASPEEVAAANALIAQFLAQ